MSITLYEIKIIVHPMSAQDLSGPGDPFGQQQISAFTLITNAARDPPQKDHPSRAKRSGEDDSEVYLLLSDESRNPQLTKNSARTCGHIIGYHLIEVWISLPELGKIGFG